MKRYKSTINRHQYWYVVEAIYINKGNSYKKSRCLGRDGSPDEVLALKEAQFRQDLIELETKKRTEYWKGKVSHPNIYGENEITKLEQLRAALYRAKKDAGQSVNSLLELAFLVDFIYNSNRIEGSKLKKEEVTKLITENDRRGNNEVSNTLSAKHYLDLHFDFSLKHLETLHRILLAHEPAKHGFRTTQIVVGNDDTLSQPDEIKKNLHNLFEWYEKNVTLIYPPELAFLFYYKFERIHPFIDGNGRMGRLLMNFILKGSKYHPMIVWNKNQQGHYNAFSRAVLDGRIENFLRFMNEQFEKTYSIYVEKIGPSLDIEKRLKLLLSPSE